MTAKWPEKKRSIRHEPLSEYSYGFNMCHYAFMNVIEAQKQCAINDTDMAESNAYFDGVDDGIKKVINEKEMTMTNEKQVEELSELWLDIGNGAKEQVGKRRAMALIKAGYSLHPASGLVLAEERLHELWGSIDKDLIIGVQICKFIDLIIEEYGKPNMNLQPLPDIHIEYGNWQSKNINPYLPDFFRYINHKFGKPTPELPSVEKLVKILEGKITHVTLYHDKDPQTYTEDQIIFKAMFPQAATAILSYLESKYNA